MMRVRATLHAWKEICGTLGNQTGWNRRKLTAKFSGPAREQLTATLGCAPATSHHTVLHRSRACLSFFIYFIYFYRPLPCSLLYSSKSLWQDTEAPARPLGAAGRVYGRKGAASTGLCYLCLAAQHQAGRQTREASLGSEEQLRPAELRWVLHQRGLPCSASPLPLACIFCSTEPALMSLVLKCFKQWGLKFIQVKNMFDYI